MGRTREFRLWGALRNNRQKLKGATRGAMQSWFPKDIPDRVHRPAKPRRTILSETFCHVYLDPTKLGSPQNVFFTFYELVISECYLDPTLVRTPRNVFTSLGERLRPFAVQV